MTEKNDVIITDDEDELESCEYYVCARATRPQVFADDLYDFCCRCGEKVRYRPHGPKTPPKLCLECALPDMNAHAEKGDLTIATNTQTRDEIKKKMSES